MEAVHIHEYHIHVLLLLLFLLYYSLYMYIQRSAGSYLYTTANGGRSGYQQEVRIMTLFLLYNTE